MKSRVDLCFLAEIRASALRFRCDDCAHFDPDRETCAHGYPVEPHRPEPLTVGDVVIFCKEFELGVADATEPSRRERSRPSA